MAYISKGVWTIFLDEFIESLKTRKALAIIISYLFLMFIGIKVGSVFEIFAWALAGSRQSFSILLPYYISVGLLPLFSIIISYNLISEEISGGSIKFMAYRTDRLSILGGKILSSFVLSAMMIFIAYATALFYVHSKNGLWFFIPYLVSWIYLSIYAFCFICLTVAVSMVARTPSASIIWSLLVSILFLVAMNFNYISFFSPFYFSTKALDYLIKGISLNMILGLNVLLLHTLLYFLISFAVLKKSDLD
ncbi:hypothetical protein COV19_07190 [Candidatus Woesearchaeota archaeon CG10_big_fil_rev_8_21_14_0_10_44_13]|nr:MAG: hypothetical protein COV19_07190 [Candidatus Woesearchaeota archaeon CG10_big_fil_rev_8_21_14_0_10_44_13]